MKREPEEQKIRSLEPRLEDLRDRCYADGTYAQEDGLGGVCILRYAPELLKGPDRKDHRAIFKFYRAGRVEVRPLRPKIAAKGADLG